MAKKKPAPRTKPTTSKTKTVKASKTAASSIPKGSVKVARKAAPKKAAPAPALAQTSSTSGRPKGSKGFYTDTIAVRNPFVFAKENAKVKHPGTRRMTLEVSTPENALLLEALQTLVETNPAKLLTYLKKQL